MSQKRDQRKREQARKSVGSDYRSAVEQGEIVRCLINADWREDGMAGVHVLVRRPNGSCAAGLYLIDTWCLGLKDADGNLNVTPSDFDFLISSISERGVEHVSIDPAIARRMVAGGIRLARETGFHLPDRYEHWTALLGDVGDTNTADLSDFTHDGQLHYQGTRAELARRLVSGTVDDFLTRPGVLVEFVEHDDEEDSEFSDEQATEMMRDSILSSIEDACTARGELPDPHLAETWHAAFELMVTMPPEEGEPDSPLFRAVRMQKHVDADLGSDFTGDERFELLQSPKSLNAMRQINAFLSTLESAQSLIPD